MEKNFELSRIAHVVLQEYLDKFLKKRELLRPNGKMLYSYQMNLDEFNDLKDKLRHLCQQYSIEDLLRDKYFSSCFVLYASEWWKREYNGGPWSWEPIFSTISKGELKNNYATIRSEAIINGFRYWKTNTTFTSGKKYLGAIIINGGLPSKFIQQIDNEYSPVVKVLRKALKFATEYNTSSELLIYTKGLLKKLPEAIRRDEICELITDLITAIIKLKNDYKLDKVQNPIEYLNQKCPNWKDQFPLLLEDAAVEKMLTGFVEEVSRAENISVKGKIPSADRVFDFSESNELKFLFSFPEINVDAVYFSKFFNIQNIDELPETFYINNLDNDNTIIAIVTRQLGSRKKYKIRSFDNNLNILNSIIISLSSANNKIHSKHITIAESLDVKRPLIFTKSEEDNILILRGIGSISLEENECYIAYKEDLFDFKEFGEFERFVKVNDDDLILLKCGSNVVIDELNIKLNRPNSPHNKFCLDGDIILYKTFPYISYRGIPKIIYYDDEGNQTEIIQKYINYYREGTKTPIFNIQNFSGNLDINFNYEGIDKTFNTITVFPINFNVCFESTKTNEGYIKFNNINCEKIEPIIDDNLKDNLKATEVNKNEFQFRSLDSKPDKMCFKLFWQNNNESLIYVPYPYFGVSFFDENGNCINSHNISINHILGKKIRIYNNLNKYHKFKINFILEKSNFLVKKPIYRCIFTEDLITEIRLMDFEENIKNLLNYSDDEDDIIKVFIEMDNKEVASIKISKYDTSFIMDNNCIFLLNKQSNEILKNTNVYAINLIDQDALPIQLIQNKNSDTYTGCWNIKNLDLKNNIYMIISDKKSDIFVRPLILVNNDNLANLSLFYKKIFEDYIEKDNLPISTDFNQENDFEKFLVNETDEYTAKIWEDIENLIQIFKKNNIPFTCLKIWKILSSNEYLLCRLLLFCSDKIILQKIKDDLNIVTATIPFFVWEISLTKYLSYLYEQFLETDINPRDIAIILENSISDKIKFLTETFPEIETTIYYLIYAIIDKFGYDIIEFNKIVPHFSKVVNFSSQELSDDIFKKNKHDKNNELIEMCWVQILQSQNSLIDGDWIYLPFEDIYNYLINTYYEKLSKVSSFLFEFNRYHSKFIENVVNFPQVCAFYAFYGGQINKTNTYLDNLIKFYMNDFMNFNKNYFIEVYKIAMSIILKEKNYNK